MIDMSLDASLRRPARDQSGLLTHQIPGVFTK